MWLRRWLFDRGDSLAGGIYGTILVAPVLAAADAKGAIWRALAIVVVTTLVFWLAHVYAHSLARSLDQGAVLSVVSYAESLVRSGRCCRQSRFPRSRSPRVGSASSRPGRPTGSRSTMGSLR